MNPKEKSILSRLGLEILETPCSDPAALEEPGPNMALSYFWPLAAIPGPDPKVGPFFLASFPARSGKLGAVLREL